MHATKMRAVVVSPPLLISLPYVLPVEVQFSLPKLWLPHGHAHHQFAAERYPRHACH